MMHGQKNIKILSIVSICVILPQDSFTSGIAHINNVQQIQMHHSSKYNFHTSLVQISWSLITLFPKWLPVKGSKRYMNFLECTVVVNLPTVTIPLNLQHVAMWWPSVKIVEWWGWLGHLAVRWPAYQLLLNCLNHILTTVLSHSQQKPNSKYTLLMYFVKEWDLSHTNRILLFYTWFSHTFTN